MDIKYTDDPSAPEKTKEEVRPGSPFIAFSVAPFVPVCLENPIPMTGLFSVRTTITSDDTAKSFYEKVAKHIGLKRKFLPILSCNYVQYFVPTETDGLKIFRYEDPVAGHRVMPVVNEHMKGKVILENNGDSFVVDDQKNLIALGKVENVGTHFIYLVG